MTASFNNLGNCHGHRNRLCWREAGGFMSYYRLYFFDRAGHIERFSELEQASDAEAIAAAGELARPQPMELWCGKRLVRRFEPGELLQPVPIRPRRGLSLRIGHRAVPG